MLHKKKSGKPEPLQVYAACHCGSHKHLISSLVVAVDYTGQLADHTGQLADHSGGSCKKRK